MSSFGRFILGVMMGSVLGAILGILLAPRSGRETRQLITDEWNQRVEESRNQITSKSNELSNKLEENSRQLREKIRSVSEELEETGRRFVSKLSAEPAASESSTQA